MSVVLPVRNGRRTIAAAIRSILRQSYTNFEIIIVDDASTDGTRQVIESFEDERIRMIFGGQHRGIAYRLNQLVAISRGKYVARMDADDIAFPRRLAAQVEYLEENPKVDLLATAVVVFGEGGLALGTIRGPASHEDICRRPCFGFTMPHPTWMGRRDCFFMHKYDSRADGAEDQQLLFRTYRVNRFACLPDVLLGYQEEGRALKKMWSRRRAFLAGLVATALEERAYAMGACIVAVQMVKAACDFANLTLRVRALRNQLAVLDAALEQEWKVVWKACSSVEGESITAKN